RCSVRTVRRWEHHDGLPVHRQMHRTLARVFALKGEEDAWRSALTRPPRRGARRPAAPHAPLTIAPLTLANLGAEADKDYFADALTEEVTTTLASLRSLQVT